MQGVGPDLTAQTFHDALFAGPPTQSAVTQPQISYGNHGIWPQTDYLGIDDVTMVWWNPTAKGPDELEHAGQRACTSTWTAASATCRATGRPRCRACSTPRRRSPIYTTVPPGETVPQYPSPSH